MYAQDAAASPLLATLPQRESSVHSVQDVYARPPKQSIWAISKVLLQKNFILCWRRRRIVGLLVRVAFGVSVPTLMWWTVAAEVRDDPEIVHEEMRPALATEICPFMGVLFLMSLFVQFVVEIVTDKELKMRYVQEVAGVSFTAYWLSYYAFFFLFTGLATGIYLVFEMVISPIYVNSSPILMFLFFTLAFLQEFFLCMMVSTILSRARIAGVVCSLVSGLSIYLVQVFLPARRPDRLSMYFLQSLTPFATPFNLLKAIGALDASKCSDFSFDASNCSDAGFTFATFQTEIPWSDPQHLYKSAGAQFWTLIGDCVVYGLFAIWFDQVYQGQFGAAKPFYFCLSPQWMCRKQTGDSNPDAPALKMVDLVKTFKKQCAVDGMSLEVRRGEIFALLGHNGAGKTTAINCITGMLPMTSGSIQVCSVDVATQLTEARRYMSVCPQDNPLYFEFSVKEHLAFFAALRGVPSGEADKNISEALTAVGLQEKRDAVVKTLSGGQKRRLWVATSLLGATPMVFLDEPTSGMDPASRRDLWDLLVDMKNHGRCILFTTHYLDEADVLAQRKAVLDQGKVRAFGTSWELKKQFGRGYHLRVICKPSAPDSTVEKLRTKILTHVPSATLEVVLEEERSHAADAPKQWSFILPYTELHKFGSMLSDLENSADGLAVIDVALETTSLQEVFMALGQDSAKTSSTNGVRHNGERHDDVPGAQVALDLISPSTRQPVSWLRGAMAVFGVRWMEVRQKRRTLWATLLIPGALLVYSAIEQSKDLRRMAEDCDYSASYCMTSMAMSGSVTGMFLSVCLGIAVPQFATTMVVDRTQRCTYVATSQGLPLSAYWVGTFLNNYIHLLVLAALTPLVFFYYEAPFYGETKQMTKIIAASICGPIPMLLFAYSMSRLFSTAEASTKFFASICFLSSILPFFAVLMMTQMSMQMQINAARSFLQYHDEETLANDPSMKLGKSIHAWATYLHVSMCFVNPFYCLPGSFAAIGLSTFSSNDFVLPGTDLEFPSIFGSAAALPLVGAITLSCFLSMTLVYDADRIRRLFRSSTNSERNLGADIEEGVAFANDPDVEREKQRVETLNPAEQAVLYKNLAHTYNPGSAREVQAVRGISLAVSRGECFTLLGPNGAGKTTTLDVLTGAIFPPTQGEVSVNGHLVTGSADKQRAALQGLGNCPQTDPLWPSLTGRQHLHFYAKIKGLPAQMQKQQAAALLKAMGFSDFDADKPTAGYSGGMRRKLALSIALIGSPPTLLLDEPSAAVDAAAKRHLWRVVRQRAQGQTVILTTHSMEEAEALSDRLAIQIQGRLRCVGTPDHIKITHGAGYQLEVLVKQSSAGTNSRTPAPDVLKFISKMCSNSEKLLEYHEGRYLFEIPNLKAIGARQGELSLAAFFITMQKGYDQIGIEDYSISRPSLEQVFIRFSKEQEASNLTQGLTGI